MPCSSVVVAKAGWPKKGAGALLGQAWERISRSIRRVLFSTLVTGAHESLETQNFMLAVSKTRNHTHYFVFCSSEPRPFAW